MNHPNSFGSSGPSELPRSELRTGLVGDDAVTIAADESFFQVHFQPHELLGDREQCEGKLRALHFFRGVLVATLEARESRRC